MAYTVNIFKAVLKTRVLLLSVLRIFKLSNKKKQHYLKGFNVKARSFANTPYEHGVIT